jgi:hypothetical protein
MKVLVFYTTKFAYKTAEQNLSDEELAVFYADGAKEIVHQAEYRNCITAFIQIEELDQEKDLKSREKKLVNHLKWVARKNKVDTIVLHSFAHLSPSKASLDFTAKLFDAASIRLGNGAYQTAQTPFGFFLDIDMAAPGFSMARVWADL